jgi:ADP-ribose pyrophosphatase YjhB (NUDIX family)
MRYTPRAILYKLLYRILRVYWFVFRPKIRGTRCLIECGGQFLLIRQTYGHMQWTLPGGLIKRNEAPETAVRREVREEVGIDLFALRPLGVFTDTKKYARDTVHCFWGESSGTVLELDSDEVYEAGWFKVGALPSDKSRQLVRVLDLYSESLDPGLDSSPT